MSDKCCEEKEAEMLENRMNDDTDFLSLEKVRAIFGLRDVDKKNKGGV